MLNRDDTLFFALVLLYALVMASPFLYVLLSVLLGFNP